MLTSLILSTVLSMGAIQDKNYWKGYASVLVAMESLEKKQASIHKPKNPDGPKPPAPNPKPKDPEEVGEIGATPPIEVEPAKEEEEEECATCSGKTRTWGIFRRR